MKNLPKQIEEWILCNRQDFEPVYLKTYDKGLLEKKVSKALEKLRECKVCPRNCKVNRLENKVGICRIGRHAYVASYFPHFGEEDCLRGWHGSGTIFFSGCNLRCVFCQNFDISWQVTGLQVNAKTLAKMMIELQAKGCHNINLVTPEHVVPQIIEALPYAIEMGLKLPIVYNTSAYDSIDSLKLMEGIVDIYMPDFKFWSAEKCLRYLGARDYAEVAKQAIKEMHRQVGELVFDENGLALRGLLIRHLVMPNNLDETEKIMEFIANEISKDTYVNIMDQYFPYGKVLERPDMFAEIARPINNEEYAKALEIAKNKGLWRFDVRWLSYW